jgi:alanine racemase
MLPAWAADRDPGLRPVLSLKALPIRIFDLPAGQPIGYGLRYRPARATRIATLGIGYGDGWPRLHANNGRVLVRGRPAPIVGAVSMDGLTVDLGQIDEVTYDDEFVLIGEQMGASISADEVAAERRTINYEVTTALRRRLPRLLFELRGDVLVLDEGVPVLFAKVEQLRRREVAQGVTLAPFRVHTNLHRAPFPSTVSVQ